MLSDLKRTLANNLDKNITITPWEDEPEMSLYLRSLYKVYEMVILGTPCLLVAVIDEIPALDAVKKHRKKMEELTDQPTVLYSKVISWYRKKTFIENRIPFLTTDGQMYLPFLGLYLKQTPDLPKEKAITFNCSTQRAFFIFYIIKI